jgi:predicted metal-dependent phosphotriesterase family hydrolase
VKIAAGVTPGHPIPLHTPLWSSDLADRKLQVLEEALNVNALAVYISHRPQVPTA